MPELLKFASSRGGWLGWVGVGVCGGEVITSECFCEIKLVGRAFSQKGIYIASSKLVNFIRSSIRASFYRNEPMRRKHRNRLLMSAKGGIISILAG